jgi:hypothetical protein
MDKDSKGIFEKYVLFLMEQNTGTLKGSSGGGEGGDWAGSLTKLESLLPMGNWQPTSLKRSRRGTRSGFMSDHYEGNKTAYAADFGLNTTFNGNVGAATDFAIKVARNAGANVTSWEPYVGKSFKYNTPDGFRVQVIWQSNVGGNHYDHVHVGVKKGVGGFDNREDEVQDTDIESEKLAGSKEEADTGEYADQLLAQLKSSALGILGGTKGFSPQGSQKALQGVLGSAIGAIGAERFAKATK